jgi:hypothetical protein
MNVALKTMGWKLNVRQRVQASWAILTVALVVLCWAKSGNAQAKYLGTISGVVSDSTGAMVPGANISARDTTAIYALIKAYPQVLSRGWST